MEVFDALAQARARGQHVALITVLAVEGEAPSRAGAKLVVRDGEPVAGTLGCAEFDAAGVDLAAEAFDTGEPVRRRRLFDAHDQPRALELFAEIQEPEPALIVLGGTPVARAVCEIARVAGRRVTLVAVGGEIAVPPQVEVKADDPGRYLLAAPPGRADAVVLTDHDAPWVDEVLRVALASEAPYVGMLGSRRHAPAAVRRLRAAGVPDERLGRLRAPVGLDIGSRTPGEIALSIVAEIIAVERGAAGGPLGVDWSAQPT